MKKNNLIVLIAFVLFSSLSAKGFAQTDEVVQNPVSSKNPVIQFTEKSPYAMHNEVFKAPRYEQDAVNVYSVARSTGITYTPLAGATSVTSWRNGVDIDDNLSNNQPIGFSFIYNGVRTDSFRVSTSGFVTFNTTSSAVGSGTGAYGYSNAVFSAAGGTTNTLAPMYEDLQVVSLATSIVYQTSGSVGNRVLTIEFIGMDVSFDTSPDLNFQVKCYEADGHIEYVYGTMTPGAAIYTYTSGINAANLSAVPTVAQLLTQQTVNTATFSNSAQNALATVPDANSMISFTTVAQTAPNSPTSLTFSSTTTTTTTLNWVDNSSNETEFPIYLSTDNVNFNYIGAAAANAVSIQIINLTPSTTYYFQVWAANETKYSVAAATGNVTTNASVPLTGVYTINPSVPVSATNFQTFSSADTALQNNGVSGPCVFNVSGGVYAERSTLFTVPGTSSINTVRFVGPVLAEARAIVRPVGTVATNDYAIALAGADYVTYENIDIEDGGTTSSDQVEYGYYVTNNGSADGATFNTIRGANITLGGGATVPTFSHGVLQSSLLSQTQANNNNKYQNLNINRSDRGVAIFGLTAPALPAEENIEISGCTLGQTTYIGSSLAGSSAIGIIVSNGKNAQVFNNNIVSVQVAATNASGSPIGLSCQNSSGRFYNNYIRDVFAGSTTSNVTRPVGIQGSGLTPDTSHIYNNFVTGIRKGYTGVTATATVSLVGLRSTQQGGAGIVNWSYNTVYLSSVSPVYYSSCAYASFGGGVVMNVADNIFYNNISTANATARSVAIQDGNAAVPSGFLKSNYNDLFSPGTNGAVGLNGAATFSTTLANWTTANPLLDINSSNVVVNFVNTAIGNLHLTGASVGDIALLGTEIPGITTDIDGDIRGVKPYMGADQANGFCALTLKFNTQSCPSPNTFTIELRSTTSPYALVESKTTTAGGNIASVVNFSNAVDGTPYYVVIKSANAVETWSATGVTFTGKVANYDFTTNINKAFGSNQILSGGIVSIFQGDANQDGFVNSGDILAVYNNAITFANSPSTDFNCDGVTDVSDIILGLNNSNTFVQKQTP